MINMKKMN